MWNMTTNALGGPFDKTPGDRYEVTKSGVFEPVLLEVKVYDGKVTVTAPSPSKQASVKDSQLALAVEQMILQTFGKKDRPEKEEQKKLDDGKTINV